MNRITKTEESPQKPIWESLLERASNKKQELQKLIEEKKQKEDQLDPESQPNINDIDINNTKGIDSILLSYNNKSIWTLNYWILCVSQLSKSLIAQSVFHSSQLNL